MDTIDDDWENFLQTDGEDIIDNPINNYVNNLSLIHISEPTRPY